jgi:hypothetical protein
MTEHRTDDHTIEMRDEAVHRTGYCHVGEPVAHTPYTYITNCTSDYRGDQRPVDRSYYARTFGGRK